MPYKYRLSFRAYTAGMAKRSRIDALHAAAPIIAADELRRLAVEYPMFARELTSRAAELDPEGETGA